MRVYLTEAIHPDAVAFLRAHGEVVQGEGTDAASIIRGAAGCDAILVRVAEITGEVMAGLPALRAVAKHGVGVDNIDLAAATARGILVLNAPTSNINAVAEHGLALVLALAKNLVRLDGATRREGFARRSQFTNMELSGRVLGLVGFGKIARLMAQKAGALGMELTACDPFAAAADAAALGVRLLPLDELLASADFVSLHTPLTPQTHHLIDAAALAKMKPSAHLINVARGPIVDEAALCAALEGGVIAGAGLDVFDPEPPAAGSPLLALENVVVSPHNAALTDRALLAMAMDSAAGIVDYLEGRAPSFPVNPEVL